MRSPAALAAEGLREVRRVHPLVHHITNNVVTAFTANVTLCLGAAPVMAPAIEESPEMAASANVLLLNIGTLDPAQVASMLAAGKKANEAGIPIVLDPVGAGATRLRTDSALRLMKELKLSVIRGNPGEIQALCGKGGSVRGVDSSGAELDREAFAALSRSTGAVVAVTGETDYVTDGKRECTIPFGHPMMGRVTGTGCGATTAIACFVGAGGKVMERTVGGLAAYGIAGKMAAEKANGPGSFVAHFLDALASLSDESPTWK
jgi:hydroxyethylthiazole kinase